ncbi:MAG: hypothetical protein HY347_09650 [candidate division NC10 bacterium]|nr:hypothetical protein [candidate division NC10 bacterium]
MRRLIVLAVIGLGLTACEVPMATQPQAASPPAPAQTMAAVASPPALRTGPVRGEILNATPWDLKVNFPGFSMTLAPGAKLVARLAIGEQKLYAEALGPGGQVVGSADKTFKVDPSGWAVKLQEGDFPKSPPAPPVPEQQPLETGEGPAAIQLAEALATPVLVQEIGKLKVEVADVQILKDGQVEVTLAYTNGGDKDVKVALVDPQNKTRLTDEKGNRYPYKTSSGLNAEPKESDSPDWFDLAAGAKGMTTILTFAPPEGIKPEEKGSVFRFVSEQRWIEGDRRSTFTLALRGLSAMQLQAGVAPTPPAPPAGQARKEEAVAPPSPAGEAPLPAQAAGPPNAVLSQDFGFLQVEVGLVRVLADGGVSIFLNYINKDKGLTISLWLDEPETSTFAVDNLGNQYTYKISSGIGKGEPKRLVLYPEGRGSAAFTFLPTQPVGGKPMSFAFSTDHTFRRGRGEPYVSEVGHIGISLSGLVPK